MTRIEFRNLLSKAKAPTTGAVERYRCTLQLLAAFDRAQGFIDHVQAHLEPGEKVICKICGKTVEEIVTVS